jgi:predicted DNA-binding transcriptional regulator AlpA
MSEETAVRFYSSKELAARYGVHEITVWKWQAKGLLPRPVRLGKHVTRWRSTDLEAHEARCQQLDPKPMPSNKAVRRKRARGR